MMDPSSPMHRKYVPLTRRRTYLDGHQDANGVTKSVSLCVCVRYKLGASHTESAFFFKWVARLIQIRSNIIYYNLLTAYTEPTGNAFSSPPENLFYSMDACGSRAHLPEIPGLHRCRIQSLLANPTCTDTWGRFLMGLPH